MHLTFLIVSLFITSSVFCLESEVFVSPYGNDTIQCGTQSNPCFSINYALQQLIKSNGTMILDQGIYKESTINISNYSNLTIEGIYGESILQCENNESFFVIQHSSILLHNLQVENCSLEYNYNETSEQNGGAIIITESSAKLQNVIIQNNMITSKNTSSLGAGLYFSSKSEELNIENCIIRNNICYSDKQAKGCGIYIDTSSTMAVLINNTTFENNTINNTERGEGGALYSNHNQLQLINCSFLNNLVNNPDSLSMGGAIMSISSETIKISNCKFYNNQVLGKLIFGGAIIIESTLSFGKNVEILLENNFFVNNSANINSFIVPEYSEAQGGAIYFIPESNSYLININNCSFLNNQINSIAKGYGGAISFYPVQSSNITINSSTFYNNKVIIDNKNDTSPCIGNYIGGGAIFSNSPFVVENSNFINNFVDSNRCDFVYGGAINSIVRFFEDTEFDFSFFNVNFTENSIFSKSGVSLGGSVYIDSLHTKISIYNSLFYLNSFFVEAGTLQAQPSAGGAIFIQTFQEILLYNSTFNENKGFGTLLGGIIIASSITGGGAFLSSNQVNISNCNFNNNFLDARNSKTPVFSYGGGVYIISLLNSSISILNSNFLSNSVKGSQHGISLNGDGNGGALSINPSDKYSFIELNNCYFYDNSAYGGNGTVELAGAGKGGAISLYIKGISTIHIKNSNFQFNFVHSGIGEIVGSPAHGGGIFIQYYTEDDNLFNIYNCSFQNNKAIGGNLLPSIDSNYPITGGGVGTGGAIHLTSLDKVKVNISESIFDNNSIESGKKLMVFDNSCDSNTIGGALYILAEKLYITSTNFNNNIAGNGYENIPECISSSFGGAIFFHGQNNSIEYSNFNNNSIQVISNGYGGAIYSNCYNTNLNHVNFTNNLIQSNLAYGGTIYSLGNFYCENCNFINSLINSTSCYGTSLVLQKSKEISIENQNIQILHSLFINNTCNSENLSYGGAIYSFLPLQINNTNFYSNKALSTKLSYGGSIYSLENTIISNCIFNNNLIIGYVQSFGGAIYSKNSLEIYNCSFIQNGILFTNWTCTNDNDNDDDNLIEISKGGAIYSSSLKNSSFLCFSSSFILNSAEIGGALFISNYYSFHYDNQLVFQNNSAFVGGGIYINHDIIENSILNLPLYCNSFGNFTNNYALSAINCGSSIIKLSLSSPVVNVYPGQRFSEELVLYDIFHNIIYNPYIHVKANIEDKLYYISGVPQNTIQPSCAGIYSFPENRFSNLTINSNVTIQYKGSITEIYSYINNKYSSNESSLTNILTTELYAYITTCPPMKILVTDPNVPYYPLDCILCPSSTYTLNSEQCFTCPNSSSCLISNTEDPLHFQILKGNFPYSWQNPIGLWECNGLCKDYECDTQFNVNTLTWDIFCDENCSNNQQNTNESSDCHCSLGYEDRLCSKCLFTEEICYYKNYNNKCVTVDEEFGGYWFPITIVTITFVLTLFFLTIQKDPDSGYLTILMFFIQVSTSFNSKLFLTAPIFQFLNSISNGIFGSFNSMNALRCSSFTLFSNESIVFILNTLLPTFIYLPCSMIVHLVKFLLFKKELDQFKLTEEENENMNLLINNDIDDDINNNDIQRFSSWKQHFFIDCIQSSLFILYSSFFPMASVCFSIWNCSDSGDGNFYLQAYPWIQCSSNSEWLSLLFLSFLVFIIYVILPGILFSFLLYKNRNNLSNYKIQHAFGFVV